MLAAMAHRSSHEGLEGQQVRGKAQRADVFGNVPQPQRRGQVPQVFEQPRPVGPARHFPVLVRGAAGGDEVQGPPRLVDGGDHAAAGAGQGAGAVHHLLQDGIDVQACADAQDRCRQPGRAVPQRLVLFSEFLETVQRSSPGHLRRETAFRVAAQGATAAPDSRCTAPLGARTMQL